MLASCGVLVSGVVATVAEKGDDRVSDKHASQDCDIYHNGSSEFGGNPGIAEMNCNRMLCLNV
jgi:hypothetical protein